MSIPVSLVSPVLTAPGHKVDFLANVASSCVAASYTGLERRKSVPPMHAVVDMFSIRVFRMGQFSQRSLMASIICARILLCNSRL